MTRRDLTISGVALALMVATGLLLLNWSRFQRLGEPGLQVVAQEVRGIDPDAEEADQLFLAGTNAIALPNDVLDYTSQELPIQKIVWDWLPKDTVYGQRQYEAPDRFGLMNLAVLMGTDRTSIHQPQYCLTGSGWHIVKSQSTSVRITEPYPYDLPVMALRLQRTIKIDGRQQDMGGVFVYWFVADGQLTANHRERMWWMARDLLLRFTLQRWAYVVYFAPCHPGQEEATYRRLEEFIAASVPQFQRTTGPRLDEVKDTASAAIK